MLLQEAKNGYIFFIFYNYKDEKVPMQYYIFFILFSYHHDSRNYYNYHIN